MTSFEEQFPSLFGLWQRKMFFIDDQGEKRGVAQTLTGEFAIDDLQKYCRDVRRVREAIDKINKHEGKNTFTNRNWAAILKQELNL
jgi:hypothetical protein